VQALFETLYRFDVDTYLDLEDGTAQLDEFLPILMAPPGSKMNDLPNGPVSFTCARTTQTSTRVAVREVNAPPAQWVTDVLDGFGLKGRGDLAKQAAVSKAPKTLSQELLPNRIVSTFKAG